MTRFDEMNVKDQNELLVHQVRTLLGQTLHALLRVIDVHAENRIITLTGRVATFYEKQLAQETVKHGPGVERVVNLVEVGRPPSELRATETTAAYATSDCGLGAAELKALEAVNVRNC